MRRDSAPIRGVASGSRSGLGRVPRGRDRERYGRRHRHVAPLPRGRRLALARLAGRASGAETPIHDHLAWGLVGLISAGRRTRTSTPSGTGASSSSTGARSSPATSTRCSAARRHPPRPDDLAGDLGLDPPADERHRLAWRGTRGTRSRASAVPSARASTRSATSEDRAATLGMKRPRGRRVLQGGVRRRRAPPGGRDRRPPRCRGRAGRRGHDVLGVSRRSTRTTAQRRWAAAA